MVEITGHEPIEDAAVLLNTDVAERFKIDGFRGLRRSELKVFARPFFISEDNPNGTIESFRDDLPKEKIIPMLDMYLAQGKFGADPFNLRPQDAMAAMQKQIEELQAALAGPKANPDHAGYKPPTAEITEAMAPSVSLIPGGEDGPQDTALEDMPWRDLVAKSKGMGLKPYQKTRTVLISEIEAKEAE